jgi:Skp family chaperone for outer membrane proteins
MVLATALAAFAASSAFALEIPLGGQIEGGGGKGTAVGYVDMDRIFAIYPQTKLAKEDYAKQLQKKRDQLAEKEAQVNNLKSKIAVLESTAKQAQNAPAPDAANVSDAQVEASAAKSPQQLDDMKQQLEAQMAEYEDTRKQAEQDLAAFQTQQSQMILGKIYEALRDLAQEAQVTLVVDKASILYGDAAIDLTDRLQAKVRGY